MHPQCCFCNAAAHLEAKQHMPRKIIARNGLDMVGCCSLRTEVVVLVNKLWCRAAVVVLQASCAGVQYVGRK